MINLKMSPEEVGEVKDTDAPSYPWGTRIELEDEQLRALGVDLAVGDSVTVNAIAEVVSHSEHESEDHQHKSISLQITDIEVHKANTIDAADALYGDEYNG